MLYIYRDYDYYISEWNISDVHVYVVETYYNYRSITVL